MSYIVIMVIIIFFFGGEFAYKSTLSTEVQKCIMNKNFPSVKDALKIFSSKG